MPTVKSTLLCIVFLFALTLIGCTAPVAKGEKAPGEFSLEFSVKVTQVTGDLADEQVMEVHYQQRTYEVGEEVTTEPATAPMPPPTEAMSGLKLRPSFAVSSDRSFPSVPTRKP